MFHWKCQQMYMLDSMSILPLRPVLNMSGEWFYERANFLCVSLQHEVIAKS